MSPQGFHFNIHSIINTTRDNSIYKVTAIIGQHQFVFKDCNWDYSSVNNYRITAAKDYVVLPAQYELGVGSAILWKIQKYCFDTKTLENDFAFAVQPLTTVGNGKLLFFAG